jgi:TRAP-type C4-dicarboxylate transport system substrate-binding protein
MKYSIWIIIALLLVVCFAVGPAFGEVFKIATLSPDGSDWMQKMRAGAREIAQKTENRVKFKFYPGGIMGNDKSVLRKIRVGQLHGGAVTAGSLVKIYPDLNVYSLPMKFKNLDEIDYIRGHMDPLLISGLEKKGFVAFGLAEGGFAYVMSKAPVKSTQDLRSQKVWMPGQALTTAEVMQALGIKPIPLPVADVRTGLQTGLIDAVSISPMGAIVLQWHTQMRFLTDTPLAYIYGMLAVDRRQFDKLSAQDQTIVREVMGDVFAKINKKNRQHNAEALKVLRKHGIQIVRPDQTTEQQWRKVAAEVIDRVIAAGHLSGDLVEILDNHLKDYRSQQAKSDG